MKTRVRVVAMLLALGLASASAADRAPRREWPARASELEAMAAFDREARELEQTRVRLALRAQAVFGEARERLALSPEEGARLRFDGRWFLEDVAPETSPR